ncbi:hypothetical protein ACP4OV_022715 [Aristida adscensionis]
MVLHLGCLGSAVADGWGWGTGMAMAHRAMDAVFGPRTINIEHSTSTAQQAPAPPPDACGLHVKAFHDCINHNGSDISKCQFYIDILNDCRRRVETYEQ